MVTTPEEALLRSVDVSPSSQLAQNAASSIARQHDAIVLALVRERLGLPDIQPQDLHGRLQGLEYLPRLEEQGYRDWVLDGRRLVRFYPPETTWGLGYIMTVNQRYQVYP